MKILLDTNILIDLLMQRIPYYKSAAAILRLTEDKALTTFITANTITDIFYILRKHFNDYGILTETISKLLSVVDVCDVLKADVLKAFTEDFNDYEDALLAQCAKRIKADYIITRDSEHFENSPVAATSPNIFLARFFPSQANSL